MFEQVNLRDICESIDYGYTASSTNERVGPNFLRITDIVPEQLDWSSVPFCEIDAKKAEKYRLRSGDIVIARTGATTGWAKYIQDPPEAVFASYLVRLRLKASVDARYIGFVVTSSGYKDFIQRHMGGAAQPNANAQILASYPVPLPVLSEQHKIAQILSAYDELIENNQRRIRILEEMARRLYREWFVHFRFPGHENHPRVPSPLGEIPKNWTISSLGQITSKIGSGATPRGGKESYQQSGISLIRSLNVHDYYFEMDNLAFINDEQAVQLDHVEVADRDVLLNITGASVGRCCMVQSSVLPARVNQHVAIVRADKVTANPYFLLDTINNETTKLRLLNLAQGGATREALTKAALTAFPVVLPTQELVEEYGRRVGPLHAQREILSRQNENLRRTRDLLLPRLLSGQIKLEAN